MNNTAIALCPHCINSDYPLEPHGLSWLSCPICGTNFRRSELCDGSSKAITKGHLPAFIENLLEINKDVDSQMDKMVTESTNNLMHEIRMIQIFSKKSQKAGVTVIKDGENERVVKNEIIVKNEIDKIFDIVSDRN